MATCETWHGYMQRMKKKTCREHRFEAFRKQINSKTSPVPHPPILPLTPEQIKEGPFTADAAVHPGRRDGGHFCYFPALSLGGEERQKQHVFLCFELPSWLKDDNFHKELLGHGNQDENSTPAPQLS